MNGKIRDAQAKAKVKANVNVRQGKAKARQKAGRVSFKENSPTGPPNVYIPKEPNDGKHVRNRFRLGYILDNTVLDDCTKKRQCKKYCT